MVSHESECWFSVNSYPFLLFTLPDVSQLNIGDIGSPRSFEGIGPSREFQRRALVF